MDIQGIKEDTTMNPIIDYLTGRELIKLGSIHGNIGFQVKPLPTIVHRMNTIMKKHFMMKNIHSNEAFLIKIIKLS